MTIEIVTTTDLYTEKITEHIIITNEDGSKISMPKSVYDQLQTQQGVINAN